MEINIDVNAEAINKMVSDAIIGSAIGDRVKDVVKEALSKLGAWDSPLKKGIEDVVQREIIAIVEKEHGEKIRATVRTMINDQMVEDITKTAWDALFERISKRR